MRFFQVKPAIYYGEGSLKQIEKHNFKNVCIATDQGMVKFGLLKKLTDELDAKGISYHVFADIESDPSTEIVEKGLMHIDMKRKKQERRVKRMRIGARGKGPTTIVEGGGERG